MSPFRNGLGLSADGRTLILAMGERDATQMAQVFTQTFQEYRVQTVLKLDGGGSSTLWVDGQTFGTAESGNGKSQVAEALLVFAPLARELDAVITSQSDFIIADPKQSQTINFAFANTGSKGWNSQSLTLVNVNNDSLGANSVQRLSGTREIAPNATALFSFPIQAPDRTWLYTSDWQLKQDNQLFGPKVTVTLIVLPPEAKELRIRIQQEIERWRQTGEQKRDELLRQIQKEIEEWLKREAPGLIEKLLRQIGCNATISVTLLTVVGMYLLQRRR